MCGESRKHGSQRAGGGQPSPATRHPRICRAQHIPEISASCASQGGHRPKKVKLPLGNSLRLLNTPSFKIQRRHDGIEIDPLPVGIEGVVPVQEDMPPCRRRDLRDQCQRLGVIAQLIFSQQPRQDCRVVIDDRIGDQPRALIADLKVGLSFQDSASSYPHYIP